MPVLRYFSEMLDSMCQAHKRRCFKTGFCEPVIYFQDIKELQIRVGVSPSRALIMCAVWSLPWPLERKWRRNFPPCKSGPFKRKTETMRFEGKGTVTGFCAAENTEGKRDQGWSHLLLAWQRETSLSQGISYSS